MDLFQKEQLYDVLNSDWKIFGLSNAIVAFFFGIFGDNVSFGLTHYHFYVIAPPLTYLILGYAWKRTFKTSKDYSLKYLVALVLILVPLIHYLSYQILTYYKLLSDLISSNPYTNPSIKLFLFEFVITIPISFYFIYKLYFTTLIIPIVIGILIQKRFAPL